MKISEMIDALDDLKSRYGDLEIAVYNYATGHDFTGEPSVEYNDDTGTAMATIIVGTEE